MNKHCDYPNDADEVIQFIENSVYDVLTESPKIKTAAEIVEDIKHIIKMMADNRGYPVTRIICVPSDEVRQELLNIYFAGEELIAKAMG